MKLMRPLALLALHVLHAGLGGCAVEPIDLADRQCDAEHLCAAEYTCVDDLCERTDSLGESG